MDILVFFLKILIGNLKTDHRLLFSVEHFFSLRLFWQGETIDTLRTHQSRPWDDDECWWCVGLSDPIRSSRRDLKYDKEKILEYASRTRFFPDALKKPPSSREMHFFLSFKGNSFFSRNMGDAHFDANNAPKKLTSHNKTQKTIETFLLTIISPLASV